MSNRPASRPKFISPKGVFNYPKLTEPDTKFKPEGEYSVNLICSAQDASVQKLMALIDKEAAASLEAAKEKAKNPAERKKWETKYLPYAEVEDEETGEPTGDIRFKFTMRASGVSKKTGKPWSRKPALFDAKGAPIKGDLNIGGGTVGKISFEIIPYAATIQSGASVKLALEAAQIIELRSWGERDASSYGFGEEEGFEVSDHKDDDDESPFDADDNEDQTDDEDQTDF